MSWIAFLLLLQPVERRPAIETPRLVPDGRCRRASENLSEDELVVCGRRVEPERYRLPIRPDGFDKKGPIDSVSRERHRLIQEGDAGIGSCSTVGAGGFTGCFHINTKRRCEQEVCGIAF
jgi:hypothetical protein